MAILPLRRTAKSLVRRWPTYARASGVSRDACVTVPAVLLPGPSGRWPHAAHRSAPPLRPPARSPREACQRARTRHARHRSSPRHGLVADRRDDAGPPDPAGDIRGAHAREEHHQAGGQLTRQRLDLDDDLWGKKLGDGPSGDAVKDTIPEGCDPGRDCDLPSTARYSDVSTSSGCAAIQARIAPTADSMSACFAAQMSKSSAREISA